MYAITKLQNYYMKLRSMFKSSWADNVHLTGKPFIVVRISDTIIRQNEKVEVTEIEVAGETVHAWPEEIYEN